MKKIYYGFAILMIFITILLINGVNADTTTNLITHYAFDGNLIDSVGSNDLTDSGVSFTSTISGQAGVFSNASSDYAYDSSFTGLVTGAGVRTVCAWFYPLDNNSNQRVFSYGSEAGGSLFSMAIQSSGKVLFNGYSADITSTNLYAPNEWNHGCMVYNGTYGSLYLNGALEGSASFTLTTSSSTFYVGRYVLSAEYFNGNIDDLKYWTRALSSLDIQEEYNSSGYSGNLQTDVNISLSNPENASILSSSGANFSTIFNITGTNTNNYTFKNATYSIFYDNGTLFNSTSVDLPEANSTSYDLEIYGLLLGSYIWNVNGVYGNATYINNTYSENYTFSVGASLNYLTYSNNTFETAYETFIASFSILEESEISLAQLVYNGTNYTITNLTKSGTSLNLQKGITIPLNINPSGNETKTFKFRFTYGGGSVQETQEYEQNVSFINFVKCGGAYTDQTLNFTFYDELNQTNLNSTLNPTSFESGWKYWLGDGSIYKEYSFQNLLSSLNNYQFCLYPYLPNNYTFKVDSDILFYADNYRENHYFLRNSTLTNVSSDILLYLLGEDYATKFFLTFYQDTSVIQGATVTVQKYFTGLSSYQTVAILQTDDNGESTMWQEVDKKYRYSIVKDGDLLGVIDRTSICSVAPCALDLILYGDISTAFEAYDNIYATNILSNLSFDPSTKIVTYSFIDTTGLANYFRLEVVETKINSVGDVICNSKSYSSAGTLTCNLTGYDGDFIARTYISRSPEKIDRIISFLIDEDLVAALGLDGVLIILILIVVLVVAAAVMSRGNPSVVIFIFGISILALKLMHLLPFGWITVVALEVLVIWIMIKLKT